ncbi:1-aminocyclopropane-1-carboxylate oxidase homolog 1-like [Zingiber officinale]|uniref:Fe2OG dioxygenase domain-containing protein n=1 Tax=Zingiber officinale TaxID=94328 RepID=A0A8J5L4T9_ZINOF|nr:1-aminocyclopropane-1-carboxylate oxidase homolog 1-like [Zingiber officinale]KAG6512200.1 hypothetical protein ZIOFF_030296 [Zingiber officinale]
MAAAATTTAAVPGNGPHPVSDGRLEELLAFDATKAGVKGLVDSGTTELPRIFIHSPDDLPSPKDAAAPAGLQVPIIDLSGLAHRREEVVGRVREASSSWGFFQLVNHGVPPDIVEAALQGNRRFHELEPSEKAKIYNREARMNVKYLSNNDLFVTRAANWRDTLYCCFGASLNPQEIPSVCREATLAYDEHMVRLAELVFELLSEALGLRRDYLKRLNLSSTRSMTAHYYPACPQPELTMCTSRHSDPICLTLLVENAFGGLQVRHKGYWVDVPPVPGAIVVNVGDLLQLISNDKFISVEHRVLASGQGPRLSVAMFFAPNTDEKTLYGPIEEILLDAEVPKYRRVLYADYIKCFSGRGFGRDSPLKQFTL